jgi:hypothetical protein
MPARTRATALAERVYSSPAPQQQVKFRPRKRTVTTRQSLGLPRLSRQRTLTQIDFVDLQSLGDDNELRNVDEGEEKENPRKRKRRRTENDGQSSASKYHTQTLTQLEFVSTPAPRHEGVDEDDNGYYVPSPTQAQLPTPMTGLMGPPKTPRRNRIYEVPSSQSPVTPLSTRSQQFLETRSPLAAKDTNWQMQPQPERSTRKPPKLEIKDTFDRSDDSSQFRSQLITHHVSSPARNPTAKSSPPQPHIKSSNAAIKSEIMDSDEDDDEDPDTYPSDPPILLLHAATGTQISQLEEETREVPNAFSDTQEAEEQLQSTIMQFTQQNPHHPTQVQIQDEEEQDNAEDENAWLPRPSQATTVALSLHERSSPPPLALLEDPYIDDTQDPYQEEEEYEDEPTLIPDSPAQSHHQLIPDSPPPPAQRSSSPHTSATSLSLPPLPPPQRRLHDGDMPPVPFSLASSQLLTRSQMLPDSLMFDSVPAPPLLIEDSEEEIEEFED